MIYKKNIRYTVYLPENLNLDTIIRNNPPSFNRMPKKYSNYRDCLAYILHLISAIPYGKKNFDFDKENGFTPINKEILSKRIHEYKGYIDYLKNQNIIEEGTSYQVGKKSRGLKFKPLYMTKVVANSITTPTLIKSILDKGRNKRDVDAENKLDFFKKFLNPKLTIDQVAALDLLENDKANTRNKVIKKRQAIEFSDIKLQNLPSLEDVILMAFNSKFIAVDKISSANYDGYPKIDSTSGRLHSPLVVLWKKLRMLLRYDGSKLANIDIVNSQPFLSIILLDTDIFERLNIKGLLSKYNPEFKFSGNISMIENMIKVNSLKDDVVAYKKSVTEGKYYEYFAEILIQKNLIPSEITNIDNDLKRAEEIRGFAKTATFRALFEKVQAKRWCAYVRAFSNCFPNVYAIFQFVKRGNNHKALACMLQRFESNLVLHNVCLDIHENYPQIPLWTIHDSIATTVNNSHIVKEYFIQHLRDIMGIEPQVLCEIWE